jgi:hypothetical protein
MKWDINDFELLLGRKLTKEEKQVFHIASYHYYEKGKTEILKIWEDTLHTRKLYEYPQTQIQ